MIFDKTVLDTLTAQAKESPRLRMNLDLRNSPEDGSQRMLNALEPGTVLPIHRHRTTSEGLRLMMNAWKWNVAHPKNNYRHTFETISGTILKREQWI